MCGIGKVIGNRLLADSIGHAKTTKNASWLVVIVFHSRSPMMIVTMTRQKQVAENLKNYKDYQTQSHSHYRDQYGNARDGSGRLNPPQGMVQ